MSLTSCEYRIRFVHSDLFQYEISKEKLANLCAECERYIGTQGGGMDQAIAFLATKGQYNPFSFSSSRKFIFAGIF